MRGKSWGEGCRGREERWATSDTRCGQLGVIQMSRVGVEGRLGYLKMGKFAAARKKKQQDPQSRSVTTRPHMCSEERKDIKGQISLGAGVRRWGGGDEPLSSLSRSLVHLHLRPEVLAMFSYHLGEGIS